ncbi:MAG: hypothetical protein MI867_01570 [Pseudomonadales bacterium]|nr:hypothetical protein [Pseudomonadales bacterium]
MTHDPENESSFYIGFQIGSRDIGFHLRSRSKKQVAWSLFGMVALCVAAFIVWRFEPLLREVLLR